MSLIRAAKSEGVPFGPVKVLAGGWMIEAASVVDFTNLWHCLSFRRKTYRHPRSVRARQYGWFVGNSGDQHSTIDTSRLIPRIKLKRRFMKHAQSESKNSVGRRSFLKDGLAAAGAATIGAELLVNSTSL
jgi:hypothetical protein